MFVHIHICTSIHTHIQHVYMHTHEHTWKDGVAATANERARASIKEPASMDQVDWLIFEPSLRQHRVF